MCFPPLGVKYKVRAGFMIAKNLVPVLSHKRYNGAGSVRSGAAPFWLGGWV